MAQATKQNPQQLRARPEDIARFRRVTSTRTVASEPGRNYSSAAFSRLTAADAMAILAESMRRTRGR